MGLEEEEVWKAEDELGCGSKMNGGRLEKEDEEKVENDLTLGKKKPLRHGGVGLGRLHLS